MQCVGSVLAATQDIDAEVIVVDNASTDGSMEMLNINFPKVRRLQNKHNVGFSKAYNNAVNEASGTYVCVLNPDTIVSERVFKQVLSIAEKTKNMGAIGVRYIDGTGRFLPECKRQVPTPIGSMNKLFGRLNAKPGYYDQDLKDVDQGQTAILAGAFMLLEKSVYLEVGGFDETYFMYGEDIDLSYKLIKLGRVNYYLGTEAILHYKGESTDKNGVYLKRFYGAMVHFYKTHYSTHMLTIFGVKLLSKMLIWWRSKTTEALVDEHFAWHSTIVVTNNPKVLNPLAAWCEMTPTQVIPDQFSIQDHHNTMIVFDAECMTYKTIIDAMSDGVGCGNRYRIVHPSLGFLIGSDQSVSRGEVAVL